MEMTRFVVIVTAATLVAPVAFSEKETDPDAGKKAKPDIHRPVERSADDRRRDEMREIYRRDADAKEKEAMRDTRHDNRVKTGPDSSVGANEKGQVDYKHTFP